VSERAAETRVLIDYPAWVDEVVDWTARYTDDESRMRLAVTLSRENVLRGDGGPFGAAVFEAASGKLVSVGVNSVVRLGNSVLHAEVVAFMMAQRRLGSFTLSSPTLPEHVLVTSC
jgi:tRNA(Arg) A34 adenosine deaminase TadA